MTPVIAERRRKYGIVGGLGPLASADVFFKLVQALPSSTDAGHADLIFQQHPFRSAGTGSAATTERKLYIFEMIRNFEKQGVTTVVLPCFLSHTFIDELKTNTSLHIVDMVDALRQHIRKRMPGARRIGFLASDFTREKHLFERYFMPPEFEVVYPRLRDGVDCVTEAVYGRDGIKGGNLRGRPVELLHGACADLIEQGVDVIVPGMTEIALVADEIRVLSVPLVDSNQVYAQQVVSGQYDSPSSVFKVGVVGGVGPAATIDFLNKVVRNTPATRDQDHIRLIVEQNPQIPDRTENLIGDGADPTVSLYATCKRLEEGDADIIAIPCNTAHAFVERIQPHLGIPIVNMLTETVRFVRESWPGYRDIGVLATSGTISSGVYEKALQSQGLRQVTPGEALQTRVMEAIYGNNGVKAGFTTGRCQEDIAAAVEGMIAEGVEIIILGCTELPLLLPLAEFIGKNGKRAWLVDPTNVLARRCIAHATAARESARAVSTNSLTLPA
ncbi:amino acid racemase [Paraburkholderia phymatum]|uniref:Aspartate racemase n=1 Tax=Paraburkholderia phymatum (strain DSM 17167 / CIP 108236 / LMG 21445 / STM815) TaxID=391038 RepID=B2JUT4_PARP8|nr:amino acid racemase [Paraburkholderia phymatum]ACC74712.1 aspartate racemase [Paraburkholderia phymatum STM815]